MADLPLSRTREAAAKPSRTARTILALDSAAERPWFLPAVSLFPLTDYVLPFLPNQMLLVALSILQPRRWWVFALTFVVATALGALLTAYAIQAIGPWVLDNLLGGAPEEGVVANVLRLVEDYGLWALAAMAMLPWPPRTGVIVCALAGLSAPLIGLAVALGRIVPAGAYTLIGSRAPHLLRRIRRIDRVMAEVEALKPA